MKAACPKPNAYAATCPTRLVLDRVADKWAVLILGCCATNRCGSTNFAA